MERHELTTIASEASAATPRDHLEFGAHLLAASEGNYAVVLEDAAPASGSPRTPASPSSPPNPYVVQREPGPRSRTPRPVAPRDSVIGDVEAAVVLVRVTLVATLLLLVLWLILAARTGPGVLAAALLVPGIGAILLLIFGRASGATTGATSRAQKYMSRVCPPGKVH